MVKIIAETLSCIPPEVAEKYGIPIIPQIINFGNDSFREGVDIDIPTFIERLKGTLEPPKTAAPPPGYYTDLFNEMLADGEPILCICPTAALSGTVASATAAVKEYPEADIRVIDTRLIGSPLGTLVLQAAKMASAGQSADEIERRIMEMAHCCKVYFMVDTLEYLARGGRIGGASALLGSMLQMKPILTLVDGAVEPFEKTRTHKRAVEHLKSLVVEQYPKDGNGYLSVMNADAEAEAKEIAADLKQMLGLEKDVPVTNVPPAIITHGGPGILAVAFFV
jgi:DegV family protein with EDD domain